MGNASSEEVHTTSFVKDVDSISFEQLLQDIKSLNLLIATYLGPNKLIFEVFPRNKSEISINTLWKFFVEIYAKKPTNNTVKKLNIKQFYKIFLKATQNATLLSNSNDHKAEQQLKSSSDEFVQKYHITLYMFFNSLP